ncbi:hypothetical protein [Sphingomonas kyungheensis]|uniref:Uncharacterized protein n=1 Tax=Sphingomonas kyungheensis TaxID=1069987 RepID=A0ABU8H782_9SPHN
MRDRGARLCGGILLAAAGATTLIHRAVYSVHRGGPATVAEFALGLATFLLAASGVLLLLHGRRLLARPATAQDRRGSSPQQDLRARLLDPITPAGRAYDTRRGAALMKTRHRAAAATACADRRHRRGPQRRGD